MIGKIPMVNRSAQSRGVLVRSLMDGVLRIVREAECDRMIEAGELHCRSDEIPFEKLRMDEGRHVRVSEYRSTASTACPSGVQIL